MGLPVGDSILDSHIIFSSWSSKDKNTEKIWAVSIQDGSSQLILDPSPSLPFGLAYLSDRNHFIIIGGSSVWLSDMSGSPPKEFTSTDQFIADFHPHTPIWGLLAEINKLPNASDRAQGLLNSPNGDYTAIWKAGDSALIMLNRQTGEEISVIETDELDVVYGNWSLDSNQFVFSYYGNGDRQGNDYYSLVYSVNANGTGLYALTKQFNQTLLGVPRWAPDGQKIMLTYDAHLEKYLLILDLQTKQETLVKISPYWRIPLLEENDFIWSPDSNWIGYISAFGHYGIEAINIHNKSIYCITNNDQYTTINAIDWR